MHRHLHHRPPQPENPDAQPAGHIVQQKTRDTPEYSESVCEPRPWPQPMSSHARLACKVFQRRTADTLGIPPVGFHKLFGEKGALDHQLDDTTEIRGYPQLTNRVLHFLRGHQRQIPPKNSQPMQYQQYQHRRQQSCQREDPNMAEELRHRIHFPGDRDRREHREHQQHARQQRQQRHDQRGHNDATQGCKQQQTMWTGSRSTSAELYAP